jgi:hypothetical protein
MLAKNHKKPKAKKGGNYSIIKLTKIIKYDSIYNIFREISDQWYLFITASCSYVNNISGTGWHWSDGSFDQ